MRVPFDFSPPDDAPAKKPYIKPNKGQKTEGMFEVVKKLKRAAETGIYSGVIQSHNDKHYFNACTAYHHRTGTGLIFSRDSGHHSSGWFKNPQYERCYHLSISFRDQETGQAKPFSHNKAEQWIDAFFGHDKRLIWGEPPHSREGKACDVWHFRLFCDPGWKAIKPKGEVYTKDFTEKGWRSFSEINGEGKGVFSMGDPT
jgi:hypothetical protein